MHDRSRRPILVLGVGNPLLGDDGVGVRAASALGGMDLGPLVEVLDGGTSGLDLLEDVADRGLLVVLDAVTGGGPPGTVYRLGQDDLAPAAAPALSLHQAGLEALLAAARLLGCAPRRVVVAGVEPASLDFGLGLSRDVERAVARLIALVQELVGSYAGD